MKFKLSDYCVCPFCRRPLEERPSDFLCAVCRKEFPVSGSIPRFAVSESYASSFGKQWKTHARCQLDSFNGLGISRERFFRTTGWQGSLAGEMILEAGSGAGRFTEILAGTGAGVFSFDLSSAVEANYENNGNRPNVCIFQADINSLPLAYGSFDKIMCLGMLQHTPDPEKAFLALVPFLKKGGEIVIDIYKKTLCSLLQWKYLLRPFLFFRPHEQLYSLCERWVDLFSPWSCASQKIFGKPGKRLFPIADFSALDVSPDLRREMAVLDTFDMYSPRFDKPQTILTVRAWMKKAGLRNARVNYGDNGIIARGVR